jgi:hypothetical protein
MIYSVTYDQKIKKEIFDWCTEQFGENFLQKPGGSWAMLDWTMQFKNSEDYAFFLLRWY